MPPSSRGGWSPRRWSDRLRRAQRGPGGGGCSAAELLRSVKQAKFGLSAFCEVRPNISYEGSLFSSRPLVLSQSSYFWLLGIVAPARDSQALSCSQVTPSALFKTASVRTASVRTASVRTASVRTAPVRSAFVRSALPSKVSCRRAPVKVAPLRLVIVSFECRAEPILSLLRLFVFFW